MDFVKASLGAVGPTLCNNSGYVILADVWLVFRKLEGKQPSPAI
jgi:hypothetical protein